MERSSRLVVVDLEHIKVPIYHSDVRDLPYENYDMEGRFGKVVEETKKLSMYFKLDDGDVAGPGRNLSDFFQSIIGWHLLFVAPIKARRSPTKFFHRSSAEETTLMLFNTTSNFRASGMGAKIVLLFQNGRPGQHKWITGELVQQKPWKKAGKDGEITIHRVQRAMRFGALSSNSQTTFKGGSSSYKLEFEDFDDLDYFNAQILPFERAQSFVSGQFHGPRRASRSTVSTRRSDTTREDSM
ncbi:hypothetical protein SLS56_008597 [Neofusicoccum ribis]|uniref:Uncharacterized protein n=1 Tax=Neofusicoccum ribis TaxID=45134 RepID=A0ABR3SKG2_9PEZI